MKGNVEKNFFYRKRRNTAEKNFVHDNDAMKKEIVRVIEKNKYIEQTVFFSPKDKRWKSINEIYSEHDWHNTLELEYTENCCYPHLPQSILKDKAADFIEDYTAEQMRDYLQYRRDLARTEYFNKIAYDADQIPKNLFAFEITNDTENLFVEIKARFFIAVPYPVETNTCDLGEESASILYDIKNGKIEKEGKDFELPIEIVDFAFDKVVEVAKAFTGIKIKAEKSDNIQQMLETMQNLTNLPFEPNLFPVLTSRYVQSLNFALERTNSTIYRDFCKKAKIRNHKMLRKAFVLRPDSLLTYMRVKNCGFKDVNIFNRVLAEKNLYTLFDKYCYDIDETHLSYFCKKCIKARGELCTIHLLSKAKSDDNYYFEDSLSMFCRYYRHIPKTLRNEIYHDGFTKFNHDALSEISYKHENENCTFKYTEAQKKLEDDIDGYSFHLPADSYKLCDIGIKLHNCVASYTDNVLSKKSTIVYAEKDGEYKICIELQGDEAVQELTNYNAKPNEEEYAVLVKWHEKHGIKN